MNYFQCSMIHFLWLVGVNDTVVNQLLSKIDGVDQLNNILVIGMTNRLVNGTPSSGCSIVSP